jgi:cytidylate kinase
MTKKHIITIAGRPGSGKSSTAKKLAEILGYQHFSSGDLFRALGKERGVDVLQANLSAEENAEIDYLVDARLREIGETEDQIVIDSRTAWHWIPSSFKVFLNLDLTVAAERIIGEDDLKRNDSENMHSDPDKYASILQKRLDSETRRYKKLYDIDPYDMTNYDLVVDTEENQLDEVVAIVLEQFKNSFK